MIDDETLDKWEALDRGRTQGRWSFNGYSDLHSELVSDEYDRMIEADPTDPRRFAVLKRLGVASVPIAYGDTATPEGMRDASFIEAASEAVPALIAEVRRLRALTADTLPPPRDTLRTLDPEDE